MHAITLLVSVLLAVVDGTSGSNLVSFQEEGKWGFKDAAGQIVIAAKYDMVREFSEGMVAVNLGAVKSKIMNHDPEGGKWGFIDMRGSHRWYFVLGRRRMGADRQDRQDTQKR